MAIVVVCAQPSQQCSCDQQQRDLGELLQRAEYVAGLPADPRGRDAGKRKRCEREQKQRDHHKLRPEREQEAKDAERQGYSDAVPRRPAGAGR